MSQYEELTTTMTDQQYLVEALTEMGYKPDVQADGTALRGYGGVSWNRPVQVIIPREQLRGALAPVGFPRSGGWRCRQGFPWRRFRHSVQQETRILRPGER